MAIAGVALFLGLGWDVDEPYEPAHSKLVSDRKGGGDGRATNAASASDLKKKPEEFPKSTTATGAEVGGSSLGSKSFPAMSEVRKDDMAADRAGDAAAAADRRGNPREEDEVGDGDESGNEDEDQDEDGDESANEDEDEDDENENEDENLGVQGGEKEEGRDNDTPETNIDEAGGDEKEGDDEDSAAEDDEDTGDKKDVEEGETDSKEVDNGEEEDDEDDVAKPDGGDEDGDESKDEDVEDEDGDAKTVGAGAVKKAPAASGEDDEDADEDETAADKPSKEEDEDEDEGEGEEDEDEDEDEDAKLTKADEDEDEDEDEGGSKAKSEAQKKLRGSKKVATADDGEDEDEDDEEEGEKKPAEPEEDEDEEEEEEKSRKADEDIDEDDEDKDIDEEEKSGKVDEDEDDEEKSGEADDEEAEDAIMKIPVVNAESGADDDDDGDGDGEEKPIKKTAVNKKKKATKVAAAVPASEEDDEEKEEAETAGTATAKKTKKGAATAAAASKEEDEDADAEEEEEEEENASVVDDDEEEVPRVATKGSVKSVKKRTKKKTAATTTTKKKKGLIDIDAKAESDADEDEAVAKNAAATDEDDDESAEGTVKKTTTKKAAATDEDDDESAEGTVKKTTTKKAVATDEDDDESAEGTVNEEVEDEDEDGEKKPATKKDSGEGDEEENEEEEDVSPKKTKKVAAASGDEDEDEDEDDEEKPAATKKAVASEDDDEEEDEEDEKPAAVTKKDVVSEEDDEDEDGDGEEGEQKKPAAANKTAADSGYDNEGEDDGKKLAKKDSNDDDKDEEEEEEEATTTKSYVLIYPTDECTGKPIRVRYTSNERKCSHCKDLCSVHFPGDEGDDEKTAQTVMGTKAVLVKGDMDVELHSDCVGEWDYGGQDQVVETLSAADGCTRVSPNFAHVKFLTPKDEDDSEGEEEKPAAVATEKATASGDEDEDEVDEGEQKTSTAAKNGHVTKDEGEDDGEEEEDKPVAAVKKGTASGDDEDEGDDDDEVKNNPKVTKRGAALENNEEQGEGEEKQPAATKKVAVSDEEKDDGGDEVKKPATSTEKVAISEEEDDGEDEEKKPATITKKAAASDDEEEEAATSVVEKPPQPTLQAAGEDSATTDDLEATSDSPQALNVVGISDAETKGETSIGGVETGKGQSSTLTKTSGGLKTESTLSGQPESSAAGDQSTAVATGGYASTSGVQLAAKTGIRGASAPTGKAVSAVAPEGEEEKPKGGMFGLMGKRAPGETVVSKTPTGGGDTFAKEYDNCMVGAGLSGAVIAERYATLLGQTSLIVEKRDHIGGNCYDFTDEETGIRVSKYGAHLFHTKYDRVWEYVQQFSDWTPYEHKVLGKMNGKHVPIPVNIDTVNELFDLKIKNSDEMDEWLANEQVKYDHEPMNSEEMALSRVGKRLYELIFKPYTKKQWDKYPSELGPEVTARIPVRNNFDGRYFGDPHQALPTNGYTAIFDKMLESPKITTLLNTDYFDVKDKMNCKRLYFSGPIDAYFAHLGWDKLEYRSLNFERKVVKNTEQYQPASVVNHPQADEPFTRIVEYKHLLNQKSKDTILFIETSNDEGDPYYPVPNKKNKDLYKKYQEMAEKEKGVTFVGRLANYKYFNMDEAILNALELFDKDTEVMEKAPDATEGGPKAGSLKKSAKTPDTVAIDKSVGGAATDVKRRAEYGNEWKGAGED